MAVGLVLSNILTLYTAANLEIPVNDRAGILYLVILVNVFTPVRLNVEL